MCVSVSSGEARVVKAAGPYSQHCNSHSDFRSWLILDAPAGLSRVRTALARISACEHEARLVTRLLAVADGGYPP